jgi:stage V sporulation protein G
MEITEVRIKLMEDGGERLQAFCSITFDNCFVIRDLKIIGGATGPFVAMPSRRLTAHCGQCGCKNHLKAAYCNQCGGRLKQETTGRDDEGRAKLYADIAHPINQSCRDLIQAKVIDAFHLEQERAKQPGYVSSYDDIDDEVVIPRRPHMHGRREGHRRDEPTVRRVPPPVAPDAEAPKREAPEKQPPAPHTNLNPPPTQSAPSTPSTSEEKKGGFGEGIL